MLPVTLDFTQDVWQACNTLKRSPLNLRLCRTLHSDVSLQDALWKAENGSREKTDAQDEAELKIDDQSTSMESRSACVSGLLFKQGGCCRLTAPVRSSFIQQVCPGAFWVLLSEILWPWAQWGSILQFKWEVGLPRSSGCSQHQNFKDSKPHHKQIARLVDTTENWRKIQICISTHSKSGKNSVLGCKRQKTERRFFKESILFFSFTCTCVIHPEF